MEGDVLT